MKYFIIILVIAMTACQPQDGDESGHGHAHGTDGGHDHEAESSLTMDTTLWTDKTELFVEFPALVVGKISNFTAHFTKMDGHKPVKEGNVTVSLIKGNKGVRSSVDAPTSPGIYSPAIKPKEPGKHRLVFDIQSPGLSDRIVIDDINVYQSASDAEKGIKTDEGTGCTISGCM